MSDDQTFDEIIAASARRLQHPPPGPHPGDEFGSYKDEKGLRLTIERLTAELAEMTANYTAALSLIDRMQADVEWSRRAGEMT